MSNAVWKLATLAGIVGIGLLVLMNAQRELADKTSEESPAPVASLGADGQTEIGPDGNGEPTFGPEGFTDDDPVPARVKSGRRPAEPTPVDPDDFTFEPEPKLAQRGPPKRAIDELPDLMPLDEDAQSEPVEPDELLMPSDEIVDRPPSRSNSLTDDDDAFPARTAPNRDAIEPEPREPEPVPTGSLLDPAPANDDDTFGQGRNNEQTQPPLEPEPVEIEPTAAPRMLDDDEGFNTRSTPPSRTLEPEPAELPPLGVEPTEGTRPATSLDDDEDGFPSRTSPPQAEPEPAEETLPPPAMADDEESIRVREPALSSGNVPQISEDEDFFSGERSGEGARVDVSKTAPQSAVLGETLTFQIHVRNSGTDRAAQVVVEDRLPRGVDLESSTPEAEVDGRQMLWRLGALEAGQSRKITVRVIPRTEGKIGTVAMVRFASSNVAETLVAAPRLKFELLGPQQAMLGSNVTFTFRVTNLGSSPARKVFIESRLPAELKHADGDVLSCEIGTLGAGKSEEIPLELTAARQGSSTYKAVVTADGGLTVEAVARFEIIGATFKLTRTGPKRVFLGRSSTFVNEVHNKDARPVNNMTIVEKVPKGMQFVQASSGGRYDAAKREVSWTLRRVEPGERATVNVQLASLENGAITSTIRAFDQTAMAVVDFETNGAGIAALSIDMSDPDSPQIVGDRFGCKVRVVNRGSEDANDVRVSIVLPRNLRLVDARSDVQYDVVRDQVQFEPVSVDARGEAVFDLQLEAVEPGDARIQTLVTSERMTTPLRSEEATTVLEAEPQ